MKNNKGAQPKIEPIEIKIDDTTEEMPTTALLEQQLQELITMADEVDAIRLNPDEVKVPEEVKERTLKIEEELRKLFMGEEEDLATVQKKKQEEKQNFVKTKANCVSTSNGKDTLVHLSTAPVRHAYYCRTRINSSIFHYTWEIDHFCNIQKVVKQLNSVFSNEPLYELSLEINKSESKNINLTNLTLYLLTRMEFIGLCSVSLRNASENITRNTVSGRITNDTMLCNVTASVANCHKLTIECTLEVFNQVVNENIRNSPLLLSEIIKSKNSSLEKLTLDKRSIDFIIDEERYSMPLNLLMLYLNSSYFRNLCDKYQESDGALREIVIDENPIVFKEMLSYIKTGLIIKTHNFNTLQDLLILAHKYDVQDLKKQCEYHLIHLIRKENVIELIKFAILYDAKDLEKRAANFIKFYQMDIINSEEFQLLSQDISNKIIELINKVKMDTNVKGVKCVKCN